VIRVEVVVYGRQHSTSWGVNLPGAINAVLDSQTFTVEMWAQYDVINGWTGINSVMMRIPVEQGGTGGLYAKLPTVQGPGTFNGGTARPRRVRRCSGRVV
jgi:hypothetical protein